MILIILDLYKVENIYFVYINTLIIVILMGMSSIWASVARLSIFFVIYLWLEIKNLIKNKLSYWIIQV